jgi:hypothetical protein
MKIAIRAKYSKQFDDLEKNKTLKTLSDQKAAIELEWRQRLDGVIKGSLEETSIKLDKARIEYNELANMDAETKAQMFGKGLAAETEYTNAVLDLKEKMRDAEITYQQTIQESEQIQLHAAREIGEGFEEVLNAFAEDSEALATFAKTVALFNIGLSTAEALAKGIAAAQSVPFPGNLAAMATTIAAVLSNIAKAKQLLSKDKQPKAPKFATGGAVSGPGSGNSDSIVANLSSGESILNSPATAMFAPVLSALNQMGGGVPITVVQSSQQVLGEEMLARAFAKGVASLPNPVVSVSEINNVNTRVKVLENLSRV